MDKIDKKLQSEDMTNGSPFRKIFMFVLPILLGSFLQQLYNAVDAIIVAHVVGDNAQGAVSSTGPTIQLLIALFMGLSSGTGVVIANYFGKKDSKNLNKAVHTAIVLSIISGAVVSIIGVFIAPYLLVWMNTPQNMIQDATSYLQIFFAGLLGLSIYNTGASIFQAVGNSRYPLYFLMLSTVLNIGLDLLFTVSFNMGVAGAAIATIISEFVSAALILVVLLKSKREYKLSIKKLKINKIIMKKIISIGLPGALQQSIISVSNVMVQSYINKLGPVAVAGYGAESKLDAFLPLPINAIALAVTTYVSQNLGAGETKRARKGVGIAVLMGIVITVFLSTLAMLLHDIVLRIFSNSPEVLDTAWQFAQIIVPFYVLLAITQILPGALRGAGKVKFTTIISILCFVVLRQVYLFVITLSNHSILTVAIGYPATWAVCAVIILIYYLVKGLGKENIVIKIIHTDGMNSNFIKLCKKLDALQNETVPGRKKAGLNSLYNLENLKDVFLLYNGKKVIGSAGLFLHDEDICEIIRVYLDADYLEKGFEKVLIDEVENLARSFGYTKIHLRTYSGTPEINKSYEKLGFMSISANDFKYVDKYPSSLTLAPLRIYMKHDLTTNI